MQTYDVTDLPIGGHNVVGALLSDGWWRGQNSVARRVDDYGTTTAFVAQLVVTFTSGRTVTFGTDDTWRSTPSHIVRADLIAGEVHDLRRRADRQHWPDWAPSESKTTAPRSCARRPRRQSSDQSVPPVSIRGIGPKRWIVDVGQNITGWIRLRGLAVDVTVPSGTPAEVVRSNGDTVTLQSGRHTVAS